MSTIAAVSTPSGAGGIGVIRVSGEQALTVADAAFRSFSGKKLTELSGYTALHGEITDGEKRIDEVVALVFRAPRSFTGEDTVEISCHGGNYVTARVLRRLFACGARAAGPGEFTKRAFLNGKIDLTEAEAVMGVIAAKGADALDAAVHLLDGSLSRRAAAIKRDLVSLAASLAVWADYPEDDLSDITDEGLTVALTDSLTALRELLATYDGGQAIAGGVQTVLCGKPNVGKSALMNRLVGHDRSIVTAEAGTTRDIIEESVTCGSVLLRLSDTAGIRDTADAVERIGVERARAAMGRAALVLAVFDGSRPLDAADRSIIENSAGRRRIAVVNKSDLQAAVDLRELEEHFDRTVVLSAKTGEGMPALRQAVESLLGADTIDTAAPILTNERQYACCERAAASVEEAKNALAEGLTYDAVNICVDDAIAALSELTGERVSDAVVEEVFRQFCVGK